MINRNFTLIWVGKIISQLGDKFYALALAWWILQVTNSPSIMGFFLMVSVLPGIVIGFFAGALADCQDRKVMLIVTDIVRGFLVVIISYLAMEGELQVWHVFFIGFSLSVATAFFDPAIQAIIPNIVEKENLSQANGMNQMVTGICTIVGPALGSMAVGMFGIAWVFLANSISYFISAFLTCFVVANKKKEKPQKGISVWENIKEGVSFIKNQSKIVVVLKIIAIAHVFFGALNVVLPFLAKGLSGNGIKNLGYLEMMMGTGLILGSIFMGSRKSTVIKERKLILYIIIMGLCFMSISIMAFLNIQEIYVYMIILLVIGACVSFAAVFWQSLLQQYTSDYMSGRVFSVSTLIGNSALPVSSAFFGLLLNFVSISTVMAVCGVCMVLLCCYLFFVCIK